MPRWDWPEQVHRLTEASNNDLFAVYWLSPQRPALLQIFLISSLYPPVGDVRLKLTMAKSLIFLSLGNVDRQAVRPDLPIISQ